jgi:hypothetical protein
MITSRSQIVTALSRLALIGILALSSCIPIQLQLHDDDLKLLSSNPRVYVVTFKSPPFEVDTSTNIALIGGALGGAGGAIGGAVGAALTGTMANAVAENAISADIQSDPRTLVKSFVYEDPVKQARNDFVGALKDRWKLSEFIMVEETLDDESPRALSEKFTDGVVLGFKTEEWVLAIAPLSSNFWIKYRAQGMLYLPQEKRFIWRELCGFIPRESTASLSELAANSGQGLKDSLKETGTRCAKQLVAEIIERTSKIPSRDNK